MPIVLGVCHLYRFSVLRGIIWVFGITVVASVGFSIMLCYYTTDWGRWIYIHTLASAFLILVIERRKQIDTKIAESEGNLYGSRKLVISTLLGIYALCWNLPHDAGRREIPIGAFRLFLGSK
jgi:uncharacterized membrane protein YfcA